MRRFVLPIVCALSLSRTAAGQETPYTADSLMATFNKRSQVSLRGAEIQFTGVIAEVKKSKVVFKSSGNDRIICELVPAAETGMDQLLVGSSLTVAGKVRGRGMMGNVTLDFCHLAMPDVVPNKEFEELGQAEELPEPDPPVETTTSEETPPVQVVVSAREVPVKRAPPTVPAALPEPVSENGPEAALPKENSSNVTFTGVLPLFAAGFAGMGIGALLTFMKMRSPGAGFRSASTKPLPEDIRRAALEALLLGKKK